MNTIGLKRLKPPWWLLCCACLCFAGNAAGQSKSDPCTALMKQKQYDLAALCYQRQAKAIASKKLNPFQRKLKGFYLTNAAKAFERSAQSQKKPEEAAALREKAAGLLRQTLDQKLYLKAYERRNIAGLLLEIEEKIGYTTLIVVNAYKEHPQLELKGYKVEESHKLTQRWEKKLRSGSYTLRVFFPKEPVITLKLELEPKKTKLVDLGKEIKRSTSPPKRNAVAFWTTLGGGGLLLASGAGLLIAGMVWQADLQKSYPELKTTSEKAWEEGKPIDSFLREDAPDYKEKLQNYLDGVEGAPLFIVLGASLAGAGALAILVAVLFLRPSSPKRTASHTPPPNTSRHAHAKQTLLQPTSF